MSIQLINPEGLPKPEVYRQVAVATGGRTVYVAGQVARTADGVPVGGNDLAAQVEQAYLNVATALAAAGAALSDVVMSRIYVVDWTLDKMAALAEGAGRAGAQLQQMIMAPVTLIGVATLAEPDLLVEVEVTAVLD